MGRKPKNKHYSGYSGLLIKPINSTLLNEAEKKLRRSASAEALIDRDRAWEIIREEIELKFRLLLDHYEIAQDDPNRDSKLKTKLAFAHVPGLQFALPYDPDRADDPLYNLMAGPPPFGMKPSSAPRPGAEPVKKTKRGRRPMWKAGVGNQLLIAAVREARKQIAAKRGCRPSQVFLTDAFRCLAKESGVNWKSLEKRYYEALRAKKVGK